MFKIISFRIKQDGNNQIVLSRAAQKFRAFYLHHDS